MISIILDRKKNGDSDFEPLKWLVENLGHGNHDGRFTADLCGVSRDETKWTVSYDNYKMICTMDEEAAFLFRMIFLDREYDKN